MIYASLKPNLKGSEKGIFQPWRSIHTSDSNAYTHKRAHAPTESAGSRVCCANFECLHENSTAKCDQTKQARQKEKQSVYIFASSWLGNRFLREYYTNTCRSHLFEFDLAPSPPPSPKCVAWVCVRVCAAYDRTEIQTVTSQRIKYCKWSDYLFLRQAPMAQRKPQHAVEI